MKKKLITSALPYINGVKHLGNLIGSILPADICARYFRQNGETVLFICGTDEHGTPAEIGAKISGMSVEDYCNQNFLLQKNIYYNFDISFDYFGRTSSTFNHILTKEIFSIIDQNGFIFTDNMKQFYSIDDQCFLPDRYIEGICPICDFPSAKGDQCDSCNAILHPTDLLHPHSIITPDSILKLVENQHLFFDLTKLESTISAWLNDHHRWIKIVRSIAKKWLNEGLHPRCITRDLYWGINVPKERFEKKVFYVWFDALIGYISITQEWAAHYGYPDRWKDWWKQPDDVELIQFMAKDNIPFHIILLPAIMMATNEKWTLPSFIKGMNWLTYDGGKFSTTYKRGIFTDKALEIFPADYWRYALFCMVPEKNDTDFSFKIMAKIINTDLANNLGNFINRLINFIMTNFRGVLPIGYCSNLILSRKIEKIVDEYDYYMYHMEYRKVGESMRNMWKLGNEYITIQQPWKKVNINRKEVVKIMKDCLGLLLVYSCALFPIAPKIAAQIRAILPVDNKYWLSAKKALKQDWLMSKLVIVPPNDILIRKISDQEVEMLTKKFSGEF